MTSNEPAVIGNPGALGVRRDRPLPGTPREIAEHVSNITWRAEQVGRLALITQPSPTP